MAAVLGRTALWFGWMPVSLRDLLPERRYAALSRDVYPPISARYHCPGFGIASHSRPVWWQDTLLLDRPPY